MTDREVKSVIFASLPAALPPRRLFQAALQAIYEMACRKHMVICLSDMYSEAAMTAR